MSGSPLRVAFAGLAHSHPFADAANVLALGGEVVGVHDADSDAASAFSIRFGCALAADLAGLQALAPDLVIATPRPDETVPTLRALTAAGAAVPVFFNKVVAATPAQLNEWSAAMASATVPVGTSSVLRFAPVLERLAQEIAVEEVMAVRVRVQHDNAGFQAPGRAWQDDPADGGGTLVTVGVHAWEMLDRVLPGAELVDGAGWTRRRLGSTTRSEDAAGVDGLLRFHGAAAPVPVQVLVTGAPGADAYGIEFVTAAGLRSVELDVDEANEDLGFAGLIRALMAGVTAGTMPASWSDAAVVVGNTVRAAEIARRSG